MSSFNVRLIASTQPYYNIENNVEDGEDLIAYIAKVSNPAKQDELGNASKLLQYMIKNNHWSPFEMVSLVMEITTSRAIARQILRHRSFSFQEFSQRYAAVTDFVPTTKARMQDAKNRQSSNPTDDEELNAWWQEEQSAAVECVERIYKEALSKGIAKEVARVVLPEGLTQSRMYMHGTLRSWIHYVWLRCGNGTQLEHQEIAKECREILINVYPSLREVILNGNS